MSDSEDFSGNSKKLLKGSDNANMTIEIDSALVHARANILHRWSHKTFDIYS